MPRKRRIARFFYSQAVMDDTSSDPRGTIRFRAVDRQQLLAVQLDSVLPPDHPARLIVAFVGQLDFTPLYDAIKARGSEPGSPVFEPTMLFSLWLFATVEGIGSARRLAKLCERDLAYQWICGGLQPSYRTLSTFYADNGDFLDATFVDILATLTQGGLLTVKAITLDGRKIPANASKDGCHREATLDRHRLEAEQRVATLREQRQHAAGVSAQQAAARRRAAEDRKRRLDEALATVKARQAERAATGRAAAKPEEARVSETDSDARKMKLNHGGFQPAFNVQTATDVDSELIVAVQVTEQASDNGLLAPMVEQAAANLGTTPKQTLADAGYSSAEDVERLETMGIEVFMPPKNEKNEKEQGKDPYQRKRRDTKAVAGWRVRMGTELARLIYRRRAPVAEGVHARQSNRGWKRCRLRGLVKVQTEALWQALAHNLCVLMSKKILGIGGIIRPEAI
jgi:transposase